MLVNVGKLMSHTSTKGGGGVKHPFNPSLVDAWFMSGLSNSDKPTQIVGVKKNKLQLKNFAFTSESGFGDGNYKGALVFDGVDDWCEAVPLPLLTDYTVICRRVIEQKQGEWTVASKSASFIFEEWVNNDRTRSFGAITSLANDINYSDSVSWQTKDFYNGNKIYVGDLKDLVSLKLGVYATRYFKGAIYYFALYNKSLTPEEIEEEKVKLENYWEGGKNELA